MMRKHFKIAFVLLVSSLPFLGIGLYQSYLNLQSFSRGNYFFENTRNNKFIKKIDVVFQDNKKITLKQMESYWRVEEADDYFISPAKINSFINMIQNVTIFKSDIISDKTNFKLVEPLKLVTYDNDYKIIDQVTIYKNPKNSNYNFALKNNDNILYLIGGNYNFSKIPSDWINSPLLSIPNHEISSIISDNFSVFREYIGSDFHSKNTQNDVRFLKALLDNFWYLSADDVLHSVNFKMKDFKKVKQFKITLFNGIFYKLAIYKNNIDYWMTINLGHEDIFTSDALAFINNNKLLYDGWYFKINHDKGKIISEFSL